MLNSCILHSLTLNSSVIMSIQLICVVLKSIHIACKIVTLEQHWPTPWGRGVHQSADRQIVSNLWTVKASSMAPLRHSRMKRLPIYTESHSLALVTSCPTKNLLMRVLRSHTEVHEARLTGSPSWQLWPHCLREAGACSAQGIKYISLSTCNILHLISLEQNNSVT